MKAISLAAVLPLLTSLASALPSDLELFGRAVGGACTGTEGRGTCQHTSNCRGISYPQPFCPNDPDDVQCCVEISCQVGQKKGFCRSVANNGCPGGSFDPGNYCPGSQDIQCCLPGGGDPPPTGDVGAAVLAKAKTAAGVPYAWGGGSCSGPSHDQPPYQYGETGYDCSGLVAWAVCQVTGRNLFAAGLRVTYSMYCASDSRLAQYGMKKYPVGQRKAGDAVFFGGACSCSDPQKIHHVGLVMENTNNMWNAPNDEINKVTTGSIVNYGENPCPYVIRFT